MEDYGIGSKGLLIQPAEQLWPLINESISNQNE